MLSLARALVAVACLLPLALPAAAHAALTLNHVSVEAAELDGNGDDVVDGGDLISVHETIGTAGPLTGATATLFSPTPGVNVSAATSPYPNAPAGGQSTNTDPFEALVADDVPCGTVLAFTAAVSASAGNGSVSFSVPTGTRGPFKHYNDAAGSLPLADGGATNLTLGTFESGRVKELEVRIASLAHPRLSDLRLSLVGPDAHEVVLAEAGDLSGTALTNTVFAAGGDALANAVDPYTGRFAPRGDLRTLEGRLLNGTWTLRVVDTVAGETGTINGWRVSAAKAYCEGIPKARFTMNPTETTPGGTVQFDATASSDSAGGTISTYEWDLDGNGTYETSGPTAQRTYPAKAKVAVKLRVTDNDGLTDTELKELPITVKPVAAVTASPTDPAPLTAEPVHFDASASVDPDGTIVRHRWNFDGDDDFDRDTQATKTTDFAYALPGTYTAVLEVTDDSGAKDTETVQVVVRNRPPVAAIDDPGLVVRDEPATLSAAGSSDPEAGVLTYDWDLDADGFHESTSGTSPEIEHTFTTAGTRTVGVRVTDDRGATHAATRAVLVTRAPVVAVAATPSPVSLRRDVTFTVTASDPDDATADLTYVWDVEDDGFDDDTAGPPALTTSWATAGPRTVKVLVTDESGADTVGTFTVLVRNILPVATLAANPVAPTAGQSTQLTAVGGDGDGDVVRYEWDLDGDSSYEKDTGTTPAATATFANAGNVTIGVRVTDDDGGTGTKSLTLAVQPKPATGGAGSQPPVGGGTGGGGGETPVTPPADGTTPTQPAGDPAPPTGPPPTAERPFGAWVGGAAIQRTQQVLTRGLLVSCRSELAAACSFTATLSARDARRLKLGRRALVVARGGWPVPAGESARKRIRLSAKARRALRGKTGVRVLVRAVVRAPDGRQVALTRVILLRR